jgi:hypothetical protein
MGAVAAMSYSILIYANQQGEELLKTGQFMQCMTGRLAFKWIPSHIVTERDWSRKYGRSFMTDVVTLWEQVDTGGLSANRATLRERIPKNIPVIRFPPFSATCLWPFAGNDPRAAQDPRRYPWADTIGAVLSTDALDDDELFAKYLVLTAERMPDLQRRLQLDIANWKAADAMADIALAEWIETTFRSLSLFHNSLHITAPAINFLMKQLLVRTSILSPALARAAVEEVDTLLRRHTGQDIESVPIHPLVAERLNLRFYDPDATYRWHAHKWTFRQYTLHYIRWAAYLE